MISIITSVHNQLAMNKLYFETLKKYTSNKFELIIIDNASTDGSGEFYKSQGANVITNTQNFAYCYTQNQGLRAAKYDLLCFFNNDIILSPGWDTHLIRIMEKDGLDIVSPASTDRVENEENTRKLRRKWNKIKYGLKYTTGTGKRSLALMHWLMFGNWEKYCQKRYTKFGDSIIEGISGSCVVARKSVFEKLGMWDETILAGDFDLYIRAKVRNREVGYIKVPYVLLGIFAHHYSRLTVRSRKSAPYSDLKNIRSIENKWGKEFVDSLQLNPS